jgi:hypothetical protein
MKKQTRSILHELNNMVVDRDRKHVFESRGENIISSAINLIEEFHQHYDADVAGDLERRLINSIRARDLKRFNRGTKRLQDTHED